MKQKIRRQTKIVDFEPKLDLEEFHALTDLLFELLKEKHSSCARLLGVSRITWRKWETTPPRWPWWNLVLRAVIKHYITALRARRGLTGEHRRRVMAALGKIPQSEEFMQEIDAQAYSISGAAAHLRRILARQGMFFDQIRLPAHCDGYNEKTLRSAAKMIGVVKRSEGFGDTKRSYWRLPNEDEDED